jgi:CubicO group peptidase (beta-lactamase class C family)
MKKIFGCVYFKMNKKLLVMIAIALIVSLTTSTFTYSKSLAITDKIKNNLSAYMSALEKNRNFQGSVLVEKGGKVLLDNAYGMSDVNKKIKNMSKSTFPIGSVTKQFTAMAIMLLQQKGLLNVKNKLSKYIPDFPRGDDITLHNLLTHTSGIPNFPYPSDYAALATGNINVLDVIKLLEKKPLDFEPGSKYSYSNSGYVLLGYIVEKVSKMSLENYFKKYIFTPLKMKNTGVCYKNGKKQYSTNGYSGYLEVLSVDDAPLLNIAFGAGCLYSTVDDLAIWDRALYTEKLVSKKTLSKIFSPYVYIGNSKYYYGYGWIISGSSPIKEVFHDGKTLGASALVSMNLESKLRIIILSNNTLSDLYTFKNTLSDISLGKKYIMPVKQKVISLDSASLDNYIGTYQISPDVKILISKDGNQLNAQLSGQGMYDIYPESVTKFFYKLVDAQITFVFDGNNVIQSLSLRQNGQILTAIKTSNQSRNKIQVDPKIYDSYVGVYELSPGIDLTITKENDKIFAQVTGQQIAEIFPESETSYFYKIVDAQIDFIKDDNGVVTGAVIKQAGKEFNMKKIK